MNCGAKHRESKQNAGREWHRRFSVAAQLFWRGCRLVAHGKIFAPATVCPQNLLDFFKRERPRATPAKNRYLVPAFIDGTIAIERLRDRQRFAFRFERSDQLRLRTRAEAGIRRHSFRRSELQDAQPILSVRNIGKEAGVRHCDLDLPHIIQRARGVVRLIETGVIRLRDIDDGDAVFALRNVGISSRYVNIARVSQGKIYAVVSREARRTYIDIFNPSSSTTKP